jgi:hypothetical protein
MFGDRPSRPEVRIELEPVTCWPLIYSAVGFVGLGVASVLGVWAWNALSPRPERARPRFEPAALASPAKPAPAEQEQRFVPFRQERKVVKALVWEDSWHWPRMEQPIPRQDLPPQNDSTPVPAHAEKDTAHRAPHHLVERASAGPEALRKELWDRARELDLDTEKGAGKKLFDIGSAAMRDRARVERENAANLTRHSRDAEPQFKEVPKLTGVIRGTVAKRDDLRGLPILAEEACESSEEAAKALAKVSRFVRRFDLVRNRPGRATRDSHAEWVASQRSAHVKTPHIVPPLVQMFQVESDRARTELVQTLSQIEGKEASRGLADRAVFDLSPDVRRSAIAALRKRPKEEVRPALLAGLTYPWTTASDHAAFALLQLKDVEAVPDLEKMLERPDPCRPYQEGKKWYVRELVRVNHLRNCLLCHPPSIDPADVVPGPIPTPGERLPRSYSGRSTEQAVRADIVYLRQDFSAMHPVADAKPWPDEQRFDYLVRTRELTAAEVREHTWPRVGGPTDSHQRKLTRELHSELRRRAARR